MPAEIAIDPEFRDLVPPLSADERRLLEESILADGCRDALVLWGDILIDGHNRHEICERFGVGYRVERREFPDRPTALAWIVRNQLGRRNLTDFQRIELAERLRPAIEAQARANLKTHGQPSQTFAKAEPVETRAEIARAAGVSRETVRKAEAIIKEAPEPVKEAVRKGETSINKAFKQTRPPKAKAEPATNGHADGNGKSIVNGVESHDPPDIAAMRAAGGIPAGVVVRVDEPEREPGDDDDLGDEPAEPVELQDEEWLATLPARDRLPAGLRKHFDADALTYRRLEAARKAFAHHAARLAKGRGVYAYRVRRFLKTDHPRDWLVCPAPDDGGCGGTGVAPGFDGDCRKCFGRGYWVK